ncbi:MAG: hypothetical protein KatS3mg077_3039 [Candidatus Binatia bacterium]|nr:MAG: hypothetical protein KatS3mg077_3039 [Candidatus Binatia bacterium]
MGSAGRHVALCSVLLWASHAVALPRYGPLEISGNLSAQQLFRSPDIETWGLVQQRNTFKLRVDYDLLDRGGLGNLLEIPGVERAKLFLLYRGVYDSVYDLTPGFEQTDIYGLPIGLRLSDLTRRSRDGLRFENRLREAYLDLKLKHLPLSFRLGRQQIVWGETDNFRMLDRVNPLDLSWHLQQETWDELRIPLWIIKGLWDIDRLGPLNNAFVEFYWNPGDWYPAKKAFLPRPWSAPIVNPLTDPRTPPAGGRGLFQILSQFYRQPITKLYRGTRLFQQGDYVRDPQDNSQVGVRFSAVTGADTPVLPEGVQFTLNYFYQRWPGDDGTNTASFRGVLDPREARAAVLRGEAPIEFIAPYVHAVGVSANYAEDQYTQTVYRIETIYEFGVPFLDASKSFNLASPFAILANDVYGVSKRDMWKGMIGFDRPTWIRPLNRKATFLILGQFFWHYLLDNPEIACRDPNERPPCARSGQGKGFRGQFSTSGVATSGTPGQLAYIDKVRDWELLMTLTATTFYKGGKIVPFLVYLLDPVNSYNQEVMLLLDYFITNNAILSLSQRFFINTTERPVFESWGVAGLNRGRTETGVKLTFQF